MQSRLFALLLLFVSFPFLWGQQPQSTPSPTPQSSSSQDSSSRDTLTDLNSPDKREHLDQDDVEEAHSFNPYRAMKDVEVGDFYFKRGNYRGALERYKEALIFKENDAEATYGVARCEEKLGNPATARISYEAYLKILPGGPRAKDARKALQRLPRKQAATPDSQPQNTVSTRP